jgi:asparagine synthase (glutamine-hydrolysing)
MTVGRTVSPELGQDGTMCGIAGLALGEGGAEAALHQRVAGMNAAIAHRGPDGEGIWTDAAQGVALAQRRLAIVDLSETGAQPMLSHSGRLVMTYNGEIYNFREIRCSLESEGVIFRGTSDSEVLLEAWERWGQERTLEMINGMFAIAIWDRMQRSLTLVRDRFGIKPLLWRQERGGLAFASELKGLLSDPSCPRDIDPAAFAAYLRHGAVPAPWTILKGVHKLEPGSVLEWRQGQEPTIRQLWSSLTKLAAGQDNLLTDPLAALIDDGEALLGDAVERQMIADVPLGAFLSGGVDSSLVVALMQQRASRKVETFTIGFEEQAWDESPHAEAVAAHLGTRHTTLKTSGRTAQALVPDIAAIYDEPFSDSSQLPTLLLCRLVRGHVTVALSGDGGDETFGGYERYGWGLSLDRYRQRVPGLLRQAAGRLAGAMPMAMADSAARLVGAGGQHPGHRIKRAARLGAASSFVEGYRQFLSQTSDPSALLTFADEHHPKAYQRDATLAKLPTLARMQAIDALSYLPDDILVKVDRASMSVGLEVRVPLLDHRIWEWAARLPGDRQRSGGKGKAVLRAILDRHVPAGLTERPKAGFAVPLAAWLRGELRDWAESLLQPARLAESGLLNPSAVRHLWESHLGGRQDHAPLLWSILVFESWRRSVLHV